VNLGFFYINFYQTFVKKINNKCYMPFSAVEPRSQPSFEKMLTDHLLGRLLHRSLKMEKDHEPIGLSKHREVALSLILFLSHVFQLHWK
jgi:hypothetical protein